MDISDRIKPISYLESHTTEIAKQFDDDDQGPIIITQNGEAKMVVMSIRSYQDSLLEKKQNIERIAFMKLVALGSNEIADGKYTTEEEFFAETDKG